MTPRGKEEAKILANRGGDNRPIALMPASWDGHRSVRVHTPNAKRGLATTTYSYALTHEEKEAAAERIAALWNLAAAHGWPTEEINEMAIRAARAR